LAKQSVNKIKTWKQPLFIPNIKVNVCDMYNYNMVYHCKVFTIHIYEQLLQPGITCDDLRTRKMAQLYTAYFQNIHHLLRRLMSVFC
jgi:hypothetical protein